MGLSPYLYGHRVWPSGASPPLAESVTPALAALRASSQMQNRIVMDEGVLAIELDSIQAGKKIRISDELQRAVAETAVVGGYRLKNSASTHKNAWFSRQLEAHVLNSLGCLAPQPENGSSENAIVSTSAEVRS